MNWITIAANVLMASFFMLYLTDYSGIDQNVGKIGFAAQISTLVLFVGRIFDAGIDPFLGYKIDTSKYGRFGKYRKFSFWNVILVATAVVLTFSMPTFIKGSTLLVSAWVLIVYCLFALGSSMNVREPLKQSITNDENLRSKLTRIPRITDTIILLPFALFMSCVNLVNKKIGNIERSFSLTAVFMILFVGIVSFIGITQIKEKRHTSLNEEKLKLSDIVGMLKTNKALRVHSLAVLINGFVWTMVFATAMYYVRWAYCANLETGIVDESKFALYSAILALLQILPAILGAVIANIVIKKTKSIVGAVKFCWLVGALVSVLIYLLKMIGLLDSSPACTGHLLCAHDYDLAGVCRLRKI